MLKLQLVRLIRLERWRRLEDRVAKCHRYGRYICVKISKSWGKKIVGIQNR